MKNINLVGICIDLVIVFVVSLFFVLPTLELVLNYDGINSGWSLIHSLAVSLCFYNIYKWNQIKRRQ